MDEKNHMILRLQGVTKKDIPMPRLAEYLRVFAALLGARKNIYLVDIRDGSLAVVTELPAPCFQKAKERLESYRVSLASGQQSRPVRKLQYLVSRDRATAQIEHNGQPLLQIQPNGRLLTLPPTDATIDGVIVGIKVDSGMANVWVRTRSFGVVTCKAAKEKAKELRFYLLDQLLRFRGMATWSRLPGGSWQLITFTIRDWLVLKDKRLSVLVDELHDATKDFRLDEQRAREMREWLSNE